MPKPSNGKRKSNGQVATPAVNLLDLKEIVFKWDGSEYNVEDAPDEIFDAFIRQHITVGWTLENRCNAINEALKQGLTLGLIAASDTPIQDEKIKSDV
jgi:hypothetical protein